MYEDIAKLNPFYEVYENFWNTESEESSLTFSSRGSSDSARSSSLKSITSSQDSFSPLEVSSSPSIRHFRSHIDLHETERHQVFLHEGSEHLPTYGEYDGQSSQFAASDYTDSVKQPLSPMEKSEDDSDSDELEPDLRPKVHPSKYPHKKLFGQDGWLGCSTDVHALPLEKRTSMMFKDIGKKIKKQVGEIVSSPSILETCWNFANHKHRPTTWQRPTQTVSVLRLYAVQNRLRIWLLAFPWILQHSPNCTPTWRS